MLLTFSNMRKVIFLDRDGVINMERGTYTFLPEHFEYTPNFWQNCKQMQSWGYDFIIITNQGGIANLNMGGNPHRMSFKINQRPVLNRAYGGGTEPEIFDPSMSGKSMMDEIKDNPGITQYFPPQFGEIAGPGGPKDDKIPAMLSNGEFVMTAKAVDNAGGPQAMYKAMNKLDPESSRAPQSV